MHQNFHQIIPPNISGNRILEDQPAGQINNKCGALTSSASSASQRSQHSAPAEFGAAGGATEDGRPKATKHAQACVLRVGAEPGAPSEARLGAFSSQARAPARCDSGEKGKAWRSVMKSLTKRPLAALWAAHPGKEDSAHGRPDRELSRSRALARFAKQRRVLQMMTRSP